MGTLPTISTQERADIPPGNKSFSVRKDAEAKLLLGEAKTSPSYSDYEMVRGLIGKGTNMLYLRVAYFTALAALMVWAALHTPAQVQQMNMSLFGLALWLLPVTLLCFIAWAALALIHRFRNRRR